MLKEGNHKPNNSSKRLINPNIKKSPQNGDNTGQNNKEDSMAISEKNMNKENSEVDFNSPSQIYLPNSHMASPNNNNNKDDTRKKMMNIVNSTEILSIHYPTLYSIIKPLKGIRPKKATLYEVKHSIEEIYSVCLLRYGRLIKEQFSKGIENASIENFPCFVYQFILSKFLKKAIVDQTLLNLLHSVVYFKDKDEEVEIFSKFLSEEYTEEDILFFLFVRSTIEKELKVLFLEKAKDEIKIQHMEDRDEIFTVLYISIKTLSRIVSTVFASDDEMLLNTFIHRFEPLMEKNVNSHHYNTITSTQLLQVTVQDFHASRLTYPECKSISTVPFSSSKQNEFYDNGDENRSDSSYYINLLNYFTNQPGDKIDNIKAVLLTYLKEKVIMIFFEKYYAGELSHTFEEAAYEIKEIVLKKLFHLIHFIFYEDEPNWNAALEIEDIYCKDSKNSNFTILTALKERLLSVQSVSELSEGIVEKFCSLLLSTPQLLNQISKIISSKRQI